MQKKAPPRVSHFCKASRSAIPYFVQGGQMRVTTELEDEYHKHQERHKEMQAIKFRNAGKHEGDYRNAAIRVTELAREKETRKHIEDTRRKGRSIDYGHNPLVVSHVV